MSYAQPSRRPSALALLLIGSAVLLLVTRDARALIPFMVVLLASSLGGVLARRRMRNLCISGDVRGVLRTWEGSRTRVIHPETMAPLLAATAYASYGWHEAARRSLARAAKGPAWDAALEQRLFVEALLDTYEGERAIAMAKADAIQQIPLPDTGRAAKRKIMALRNGIGAFTRVFAHRGRREDAKVLAAAAAASPLVHWAMRYALAVLAIDEGQRDRARHLLEGAPSWPAESAFRTFHDELLAQ